MAVIAFYNIKGGVGKTASSVNIAWLAAQEGIPTLLIDIDPQASSTYYFRIAPHKRQKKRALVKGGKTLSSFIKETDYPNLYLLPAVLSYRNLDLAFNENKNSRLQLRNSIKTLKKEFKLIIIDSPPNITLVSENIFRAADYLFLPLIPTTLSVLTLEKIFAFFKKRRWSVKKIFPFFTMVEIRKNIHRTIMEESATKYNNIMQSRIPYTSVIERMGIEQKPVFEFQNNSKGSEAYRNLWLELKNITKLG